MKRLCTLAFAAALFSPQAIAAGFEAKTMRDTLSAREVERSLVLAKGWLEFGLGTDIKQASGAWSSDGTPVDWSSTEWLYTTQRLDLRYGITRRGELFWNMKTHYLQLTNTELGTDTAQFGLGDPRFGYKFEIFRTMAPLTSVIAYAEYKAPAGNESPGNYVGGPTTFTSFVTTTGTPDLALGVRAKRQVGPVAIEAGLARVRRFSGVVQYAIETDNNQFQGRLKPGNEIRADGSVLVQAGPIALQAGGLYVSREALRIGNTAKGWFPAANLKVQEGSEGWSLDARYGAIFHVTRGFDVVLAAQMPIQGEDLMYFPIEDLHPTRGNTYSGTLEFRY
jgi:hypothetical protein